MSAQAPPPRLRPGVGASASRSPRSPRCSRWPPGISAAGRGRNQPAKLAAFEGPVRDAGPCAPVSCRLGRRENGDHRVGVAIPGMLSWLVHGDADAVVPGLRETAPAKADRPPVNFTFQLSTTAWSRWVSR
ncbi:MAG: cytochrome ubiquinol oxidase subunit I [Opitutaceae bacterium]|nr:cytochrome ubiquinol oxidase subunit I [Opitutaceae bacterium]